MVLIEKNMRHFLVADSGSCATFNIFPNRIFPRVYGVERFFVGNDMFRRKSLRRRSATY